MKGQTQAVTAVLVTTIIVGAVAGAYTWGTPLLQKSQAQSDLGQVESEALSLHSTILNVKDGGTGTAEQADLRLDVDTSEETSIDINEEEDAIEIRTRAERPPYPMDTWTLIEGKSLQNLSFSTGDYGIKGEDLSGVVAVEPIGGPGSAVLTYRIEFRNLYSETPDGDRLEKADIRTRGRSTATGDVQLMIANEGREYDLGEDRIQLSTGEEIERQRTIITVNIQG